MTYKSLGHRKVKRDKTVSFRGRCYELKRTGTLMLCSCCTEVTVIISLQIMSNVLDTEIFAYFALSPVGHNELAPEAPILGNTLNLQVQFISVCSSVIVLQHFIFVLPGSLFLRQLDAY